MQRLAARSPLGSTLLTRSIRIPGFLRQRGLQRLAAGIDMGSALSTSPTHRHHTISHATASDKGGRRHSYGLQGGKGGESMSAGACGV